MMMNIIKQLITVALSSGISVLLSPSLANSVDLNLTTPETSYGICISVVDLLSDQLTVQSLTDFSEVGIIIEPKIYGNHQQEIQIERRGSERHR
jgi:hypothetical protein